jgi:hypothetical protein
VADLLSHHFADKTETFPTLVTGQMSYLLAIAEEWVEAHPSDQKMGMKSRIKERTTTFKKAAQARLKG